MSKVNRSRTLALVLVLSLTALAAVLIPVATTDAVLENGMCSDPEVCNEHVSCNRVCEDFGRQNTCGSYVCSGSPCGD